MTINSYRIIYNLIDDVKAAMEGRLRQVEERVPQGAAKVKAVFGTGKKRVAGCEVTEGKLVKGAQVEVKRGKDIVYKGKLTSLRCAPCGGAAARLLLPAAPRGRVCSACMAAGGPGWRQRAPLRGQHAASSSQRPHMRWCTPPPSNPSHLAAPP